MSQRVSTRSPSSRGNALARDEVGQHEPTYAPCRASGASASLQPPSANFDAERAPMPPRATRPAVIATLTISSVPSGTGVAGARRSGAAERRGSLNAALDVFAAASATVARHVPSALFT